MYRGAPPGDRNSSPLRVPAPEKFEEADTNNDNVIDKEEAVAFTKKEKEKKIYPFWVIGGILALSLLACLCTPAPAAYIKTKLISLKEYLKELSIKLLNLVKRKK